MGIEKVESLGTKIGENLYSVQMEVVRSVPFFQTHGMQEFEGCLALLKHPTGLYKLKVINAPDFVGMLGGYALIQMGDVLRVTYMINNSDNPYDHTNYFINMQNLRTAGRVVQLRNITLDKMVDGYSR